jgi:hypothetical protein
MQNVPAVRTTSLAMVGLAIALAVGTSALFQAPRPGVDLAPTGGSESLIQILQGNQNILWTSLSGSVTSFVVQGWPSTTGNSELGGALMLARPANGEVGVIDFGEKPMSLEFQIDR